MSRSEEVLSFWFGPSSDYDDKALGERFRLWFRGGPEVDREIKERFGDLLEQVRRGEFAAWADTSRGRLALIILLDQFSRNAYRGTPDCFAQDHVAQQLAVEGLDRGMDAALGTHEKMFFAMPLCHAENLEIQDRSVRYCENWVTLMPAAQQAFAQMALGEVRRHRELIARFGRFPTRNQALGRAPTPEEAAYVEEARAKGSPV